MNVGADVTYNGQWAVVEEIDESDNSAWLRFADGTGDWVGIDDKGLVDFS